MLACGGEDRSVKGRILLCGGADMSGTELDHALWWKRVVNLHWRAQNVRVVYKALLMRRRRQQDSRRSRYMTTPTCSSRNPRCPNGPETAAGVLSVVPFSTLHLFKSTATDAWQSDMQSWQEANRKMLTKVIAMDETFLLG